MGWPQLSQFLCMCGPMGHEEHFLWWFTIYKRRLVLYTGTSLMARNGTLKSCSDFGSCTFCLKAHVWPLFDMRSVRCSSITMWLCLYWQDCRVGVAVCSPCLRQQLALTAAVVIEGSPQVREDWDDLVECWGCCRSSTSSTHLMYSVWTSCWDEDLSSVATAQTAGAMSSGQLEFSI